MEKDLSVINLIWIGQSWENYLAATHSTSYGKVRMAGGRAMKNHPQGAEMVPNQETFSIPGDGGNSDMSC